MAVVGDAYIVVRALTNRVRPEIQKAFSGLDDIGAKAGDDISSSFNDSISRGAGRGGGGGGLFGDAFQRDAENARIKLRGLTQAGFFVGPALSAAGGAVGALGAGIVVLGTIAAAAAQGGIVILGGALTAAAQAAITAKLAFSGVAAALSAGIKASEGGGAATKALAAANDRLKKAQLALFRVEQDRKDQIKDIQRANADAQRSALDGIISANRSQRSYDDAQRNTRKVIEQVTKAREDAVESLQQLRFETEGGAISEKKARLEFEKARDSLQRVQDLPPNSRARQEAELAFSEADLNLRKAIDRNADLKDSEKKKTVEVAKLRATDIKDTQEVIDAVQDERDARLNASRARIDADQAIADAKNSQKDIDSGKAFRDINRTLADANQAVVDAKKGVADAGAGVTDAFQKALEKLSPEAQRFVKYLISIQGEFKKLKAAAGEELFPKLEIAINNLVKNLFPKLAPLLKGTGDALGDVAINLSKVITDGDNLKSLESVWKTNDTLIRNLGKVVGNLYTGFLNILEAAGPLITKFGKWLALVTGTWSETQKLNNQNGTLTKKFDRIGEILADIGDAIKPFYDGLKDIFSVIIEEGGAVDILVGYLKKAADNFKAFTSAGKKDGSLKKFFNDATINFTKILDLVGNIIGELFKLGDNPGTGEFIDSLNKAVDTFGRIGEKLTGKGGAASGLGTLIEKFALLSEKLTDSGSIEAFFKVLNGALDIANEIFGNAVVQKILIFVGTIAGLAKGFGLVLRVLKFVGLAFSGVFIKIFKFAKDPFAALRKGSGLTRAELKKQMIVDRQKKDAMNGIFTSGKQAARGIDSVTNSSKKARPTIKGAADGIKRGLGGALDKVKIAAGTARTALSTSATKVQQFGIKARLASVGTNVKAVALRGLGAAGRVAGVGLRAAGRGLALLGGPIGIILLLLPLIIENWDKIVAFFRGLIPKLGEIFGKIFEKIPELISGIGEKISNFFTETFVPKLKEFGLKALKILAFILFPIPTLILKFWPQITAFFTDVVFPWFKALPGRVLEFVKKIWNFLSDGIEIAWDFVVDYFIRIFKFYTSLPGKILNLASKVWTFLSDGISTAWKAVTGYITGTLIPYVTGLPGRMTKALSGLWSGLLGGIQAAWQGVKNWWNANVASKKLTIGGFKVLGVSIPKVEIGFPRLAQGGVIPATPGGMMAMIGEGGRAERVEPLDANGLSKRDKAMIDYMSGGAGRGITIVVNPSAGMNERELAELVSRRLAQQMRVGAA
jgi:hypothetical protein